MKIATPLADRKSLLSLAAILLVLPNVQVAAQELTPVRQIGRQSSANPYELTSEGLAQQRRREFSRDSIAASATTGEDLNTWWDGMSEVAEASVGSSAWALHYGVTAGYEYDDNFNLDRPTIFPPGGFTEGDTSIFFISPYAVLTYGEPGHGLDFQLRYSPEFRYYSNENLDPVLNHSLSADLGINGARSRVNVNLTYNYNEGDSIEVGSLVSSNIIGLSVIGSYDVSPKTTVGASFTTRIAEYDVFNSFGTFGVGVFADYAVAPKTRLGVGLGYEHTAQDNNFDSNAINANLRINWAATAKSGLAGYIGAEHRMYNGGENITSPVGRLGIYHNPTEKIALNLALYRQATPSIGVTNGMFYATGAALSGAFQVSSRMTTQLAVGYENAQYESTGGIGTVDRRDNYFFVRPSLTYFISNHLSTTLFYQYSNNDSSGLARNTITSGMTNLTNSYSRNQVGISVTLAY